MSRSCECPKCGQDISDSRQTAEPDVGIFGTGWYCEACDIAVDDDRDDYDLDHRAELKREEELPTASDELRQEIMKLFQTDDLDCRKPLSYLLDKNFTEKAGLIRPPGEGYMVSKEEWIAICFLCDEWDFGYLPEPA